MSHSEPFLRHLAIMCIDDVIHKTGNTYYIATLPEEDWATVIGYMHLKF